MALFPGDKNGSEHDDPEENKTAQFFGPGRRMKEYITHHDRIKDNRHNRAYEYLTDEIEGHFEEVKALFDFLNDFHGNPGSLGREWRSRPRLSMRQTISFSQI